MSFPAFIDSEIDKVDFRGGTAKITNGEDALLLFLAIWIGGRECFVPLKEHAGKGRERSARTSKAKHARKGLGGLIRTRRKSGLGFERYKKTGFP